MKIVELTSKILLPLTNEESELLDKFSVDPVEKNSLNDREQMIANHLTNKDVLLRTNDDGKIYYRRQID